MTNSIATIAHPAPNSQHTDKPHALYDGIVFVVWAIGVLICVKALRQLNQIRHDK